MDEPEDHTEHTPTDNHADTPGAGDDDLGLLEEAWDEPVEDPADVEAAVVHSDEGDAGEADPGDDDPVGGPDLEGADVDDGTDRSAEVAVVLDEVDELDQEEWADLDEDASEPDESAEADVVRPAEDPSEDPIEDVTDEPAEDVTDELIDESTDDQAGDQAGDQVDEPADDHVEVPVDEDHEEDADIEPVPEVEPTGHPAVDSVLERLDGLREISVHEHVAVFEEAHTALRRALDESGPQG